MLRTYSKNITATTGNAIVFNTNKILTGKTVSHSAGSSSIVVNSPGYYEVNLDLSASTATAGLVTIQLYADGVAIPDAVIITNLAANSNVDSSFSTIIRATPGTVNENVSLTVVSDTDLTLSSIALGIDRIA